MNILTYCNDGSVVIHCMVTGLVQYLMLEIVGPLVVIVMRTHTPTQTSLTVTMNLINTHNHWLAIIMYFKVNDNEVFILSTIQLLNGY